MVTLSCKYANAIYEVLGITFVNGYKTMTDAEFKKMTEIDPEYWQRLVDNETIVALRAGQKPADRTPVVIVRSAAEEQRTPQIPVFKPETVGFSPVQETEIIPSDESKPIAPTPGAIDQGTITVPQGSEATLVKRGRSKKTA